MPKCTCEPLRRGFYESLFEALGPGLAKVWTDWFAFSAAAAFHSFTHRLQLDLPTQPTASTADPRIPWLYAIAETLVVALDIDRIEIKMQLGSKVNQRLGAPEFVIEGPRGVTDDDQAIFSDKDFQLRFPCERSDKSPGALGAQIFLFSRYAICPTCMAQIHRFLLDVDRLWSGYIIRMPQKYYVPKQSSAPIAAPEVITRNGLKALPEELLKLKQTGMSETLEAHYNSNMSQIRQFMVNLGGELGLSLFDIAFCSAKGTLDPWAFNIIFKKSEGLRNPGFGYILTNHQIEDIYTFLNSFETDPSFRAKVCKTIGPQPAFLTTYDQLQGEDPRITRLMRVHAKAIEAVWQMHHCDSFIREGYGLMRQVLRSHLTIATEAYTDRVGKHPIRWLEDALIHKRWVMEVPMYSQRFKPHIPSRHDFRGIAWLMSNYPLPPTLRIAFQDIVRRSEGLLVAWIEQFQRQAALTARVIETRKRFRSSWATSHNDRLIRERLSRVLTYIPELSELSTELALNLQHLSLRQRTKEPILIRARTIARQANVIHHKIVSIQKFAGPMLYRDRFRDHLLELIEALYREAGYSLQTKATASVEIDQLSSEAISRNEGLAAYVRDATFCLVQNSITVIKRIDAEPPYLFRLSIKSVAFRGGKTLLLTAQDTAGGLTKDSVTKINQMFHEYISGWKRHIRLESDEDRWVCRLQALLHNNISINDENHRGWFSLIVDRPDILGIRISNAKSGKHKGLKVVLRVSLREEAYRNPHEQS